MRARYKGPDGTGIIEVEDDATVGAIYELLQRKTGIRTFSLKKGPPMAMTTVDTSQMDVLAKSVGLNGETITIVPENEGLDTGSAITTRDIIQTGRSDYAPGNSTESTKEIYVPWPERDGTLLLRVMPSDNSCLFTAFGGVFPQQIPPTRLRRMMVEYIQQHPGVYTDAVLGAPTHEYCQTIIEPDRWGGGIELSILSSIFNIRICTYDIQTKSLIEFGENKPEMCILAYSGIHYDRVAFSYSDFPHDHPQLPPEMDRTTWPMDDEEILTKAGILVSELHSAHYYTDMDGLILKCDVTGCPWIGSGDAEGRKHAEETGHTQLSEVLDPDGDGVLRKCTHAGCDFMGQGDKSARKHTSDTGHHSYCTIPDQ